MADERGDWIRATESVLRAAGWRVRVLDDWQAAPADSVPNLYGQCPSDASERVRTVLEQLHRQFPFDLVIFAALGGLGFRAIQARRAGVGLDGATLAVCLDSCSSWERQQQQRWPDCLADLELDYIERYAFEHAEEQQGWSESVLQHVRANNWAIHPDGKCADRPPPVSACQPLVTLCVPHYNLGRYLPETLESIAAQTWNHLEVLVIDDGSTDPDSQLVFQAMRQRYPRFRFLTQTNSGIGATRNRGLREGQGEYFIPVDADNLLSPTLVERLVAGIQRRPELGALTCYFLAFEERRDLDCGRYRYACRPTGGPLFLASVRNVYGDALAIYRTKAFRAVGGYETDRDTSFEDWEAFVKLVRAGYGVDVLPEHLFFYRHREGGFSRITKDHANRERVLRQFHHLPTADLPAAETAALWKALAGFHQRSEQLDHCLRYRIADRLYEIGKRVPGVLRAVKWGLRLLHCQR